MIVPWFLIIGHDTRQTPSTDSDVSNLPDRACRGITLYDQRIELMADWSNNSIEAK